MTPDLDFRVTLFPPPILFGSGSTGLIGYDHLSHFATAPRENQGKAVP